VEHRDHDPLIPSVSEVRARLTRTIEETKLLRRLLRVSEDAEADEYRRRSQVSRYRQSGGPNRGDA
jgi:hypothetical protein